MGYNPKDFYFRKAKEQNFAARSVFKLEEIDDRFHVLKPGNKILDLGCAPGSWTQYASQKIGPKGFCIGIDLAKVNLALTNARFEQGDAFDEPTVARLAAEHSIELFDIVMSDMAPKTSGIRVQDQQRSFELCSRALDVAKARLRKGGHFIVKFFMSDEFDGYLKTLRPLFEKTEIIRPKSTRKASYEIFIVGLKKL
ncbi:MAG: RlmE family RNA methyltransferase [Deltaproteobacteria bacterium]|nr:RlmE family RNA methyltransferase [Deltaproteobacteria bacterium]